MSTPLPLSGVILIVDDNPANLRLLSRVLNGQGFKVRPARSGPQALRAAEAARPDLVLLDIKMPGMDGYEVCERLKANAELADVPVVFISALDEIEDKVKGFGVGGVDYITKPFQEAEVVLRVKAHLTIARQRAQLEAQYAQLTQLEAMRELLVNMIVHDLKNPLQAVLGFGQLIQGHLEQLSPARLLKYANTIVHDTRLALNMIQDILDMARFEDEQLTPQRAPVELGELIEEVIKALSFSLERKGLRVVQALEPALPELSADARLLWRVLFNILTNAARFSPPQGQIELSAQLHPGHIRVAVVDEGPGVAPEHRDRIFEKFGRVEASGAEHRDSTGLGLTFCRMAIEAHGGRIGVADSADAGACFWFELPR